MDSKDFKFKKPQSFDELGVAFVIFGIIFLSFISLKILQREKVIACHVLNTNQQAFIECLNDE